MSNWLVRPALPSDVPEMLRIAAACDGLPDWTEQTYKELFAERSSSLQRIVLIAEAAGGAVAFGVLAAIITPPPIESEVESLAVHPDWRRHGIGRSLLSALLASAGALGEGVVRLEVRASNRGAIALYQALGFRETGRRADYYRHPVEDAVLLGRPVDGTLERQTTASGIISATYGS